MNLPREAWKEDPQEMDPQEPPPGPDPQSEPIVMNEYTELVHIT